MGMDHRDLHGRVDKPLQELRFKHALNTGCLYDLSDDRDRSVVQNMLLFDNAVVQFKERATFIIDHYIEHGVVTEQDMIDSGLFAELADHVRSVPHRVDRSSRVCHTKLLTDTVIKSGAVRMFQRTIQGNAVFSCAPDSVRIGFLAASLMANQMTDDRPALGPYLPSAYVMPTDFPHFVSQGRDHSYYTLSGYKETRLDMRGAWRDLGRSLQVLVFGTESTRKNHVKCDHNNSRVAVYEVCNLQREASEAMTRLAAPDRVISEQDRPRLLDNHATDRACLLYTSPSPRDRG